MRLALTVSLVLLWAGAAHAQIALGARASHHDVAGPVVVFTSTQLFLSRDDGATFAAMPAPVPNVRDVAIERSGALVVLGGSDHGEEAFLARVQPDGSVTPIPLSGWVQSIAVGGDVLVATFPFDGAIGISTGGGSIVQHAVPPTFATEACTHDPGSRECSEARLLSGEASLFVDRDGVAHLVDVEVNTCGSSDILDWARLLRVEPDGDMRARALFHPSADHDGASAGVVAVPAHLAVYPTRWNAGPHGWVYALASVGRIATLGRSAAAPILLDAVGPPPPGSDLLGGAELPLASNGALTVAQLGGQLVRLDGTRVRVLVGAIPDDAGLADVDARGRVLALGEHGLVRWSRRGGWQALWSPP